MVTESPLIGVSLFRIMIKWLMSPQISQLYSESDFNFSNPTDVLS